VIRIRARHYRSGDLKDFCCHNGYLSAVNPASNDAVDLEAPWIAPALFDLQVNGCHGHAFNSSTLTAREIQQVVTVCHAHGISALCPTLVTGPFDALNHGFVTLARACDSDPALNRALPCFHLEGPYISPDDGPRGAHPRAHVRSPDWNEFQRWQESAGGRIRLVTLAPEHDGALRFIEQVTAAGVVVAIGHTAATSQRIREAVHAGAKLSTHLGNGSHALLPRHDNYLWEQLAHDELWASVIADGHHLPPAILRCLVRVKTPTRTVLTCDASSLAGLPPGRYLEWGQELEVRPEGKVVVPGTTFLAGSALFTDTCVNHVVRAAGVSVADALDMAGLRPRELLSLTPCRIEAGDPADFVLFDTSPERPFALQSLVLAGQPYKPHA